MKIPSDKDTELLMSYYKLMKGWQAVNKVFNDTDSDYLVVKVRWNDVWECSFFRTEMNTFVATEYFNDIWLLELADVVPSFWATFRVTWLDSKQHEEHLTKLYNDHWEYILGGE